jgi:hypothetical protein
MTNKQRIRQLEKTRKAKDPKDNKIWVYMFGKDGRVSYGSDELIGKTEDEVKAITGADDVELRVVRADKP